MRYARSSVMGVTKKCINIRYFLFDLLGSCSGPFIGVMMAAPFPDWRGLPKVTFPRCNTPIK